MGKVSSANAVRLTLTIASHIYLLEPQWNPFVELQAMARAQRIGQTRQVVCVRYVMEGTIEQVREQHHCIRFPSKAYVSIARRDEASKEQDSPRRRRVQKSEDARLISETTDLACARNNANSR